MPLAETVFDRKVAMANVDGDAGLLKEIAALFLGEYPKTLREMTDAVARSDAAQVERTAHGLKGSVSNFGAQAAMEATREIESLARKRELAEIAPAMERLTGALAALRAELEKL
jgi:HPt (histidine-containing phosphotransfer) domain-containing protein